MKVVVDTNIFVSAIMNADGAPRDIIRLCLQARLTPLMGNSLFAEYEDVCARENLFAGRSLSSHERAELLDAFLSVCLWVPIYYLWRPNLRDEADNNVIGDWRRRGGHRDGQQTGLFTRRIAISATGHPDGR